MLQVVSAHICAEVRRPEWVQMIARQNEVFDAHLRQFTTKLRDRAGAQYSSHLANLCTRLDYNGFYTKHLGLTL